MEIYVVDGRGNLLDLEILPRGDYGRPSAPAPIETAIDPAILSFSKPPTKTLKTASPTAIQHPKTGSAAPYPVQQRAEARQTAPIVTELHESRDTFQQQQGGTSATLTGPFEQLSINGLKGDGEGLNGDTGAQKQDQTSFKRRNRRKLARGKERPPDVTEQAASQANAAQKELRTRQPGQGKQARGNGWRETPLLEETTRPKSELLHPQGGSGTRKLSRREMNTQAKMEKNGWATEDATDIQEMGDFDFSANLSKFDKRGVFDQLKQEDTTADEDRLVSHNRLPPRLGTAGGKNLHFTENVLDSPKVESRVAWSSGDSEADGSAGRFHSGRSSRRSLSRVSTRQPPSRKGSTIVTDQYGTGSGSVRESKSRTRWASRAPSNNMKAARDISSSRDTTLPHLPTFAQSRSSLRIITSDQVCPCVTPLQMLELEQLAINEQGMTEEMMSENASRSIAETASKLVHPMSEHTNKNRTGPGPVVVVLAGNTKSGARAIAGARQLRNHGARVMVTLLGLDREDELLELVRRQITLYQNCGGHLTQPARLNKTLKNLRAKPDLIIDALLGIHLSFEDLRTDDQETYFGLASWAKNSAHVMAIDVPSGIDASSGTKRIANKFSMRLIGRVGSATVVDGIDLVIRPDFVLSLGAPKTGLLAALGKSIPFDQIQLLVADVGISNRIWKKFGTRFKYGVDFGSEWTAGLRYQVGVE